MADDNQSLGFIWLFLVFLTHSFLVLVCNGNNNDGSQGLWVQQRIGFVTQWYFDYKNPDRFSYVSTDTGIIAALDLEKDPAHKYQLRWRQILDINTENDSQEDRSSSASAASIDAFLYNYKRKYLLTLTNGNLIQKWNINDGSLKWQNTQFVREFEYQSSSSGGGGGGGAGGHKNNNKKTKDSKNSDTNSNTASSNNNNNKYKNNRGSSSLLSTKAKIHITESNELILIDHENNLVLYNEKNQEIFTYQLFSEKLDQNNDDFFGEDDNINDGEDMNNNNNHNNNNTDSHSSQKQRNTNINEIYIDDESIFVVSFFADAVIVSQISGNTGTLAKRESFKHECSSTAAPNQLPEHFQILSIVDDDDDNNAEAEDDDDEDEEENDNQSLVVLYECFNDITPLHAFSIKLNADINTFQFTPLSISFDKQYLAFQEWRILAAVGKAVNDAQFTLIANKVDTYSVSVHLHSNSIKLRSPATVRDTQYTKVLKPWIRKKYNAKYGQIVDYWSMSAKNIDLIAVQTEDGSLCVIEDELTEIRWCRDEALAYPRFVEFFDETNIFEDDETADEYMHTFPSFFQRLDLVKEIQEINTLHWIPLFSDWIETTFEKIITVLTQTGKLFGILSNNGKILWSVNLNLREMPVGDEETQKHAGASYSIVDMVVLSQHPPHLLVVLNADDDDDHVRDDKCVDADEDECEAEAGDGGKYLSKLVSISSPFHSEDVKPHVSVEHFAFHIKAVLTTPWLLESFDNKKIILFVDAHDTVHVYNPHRNRVLSQFIRDKSESIFYHTISMPTQSVTGFALVQAQTQADTDLYRISELWTMNFINTGEKLITYRFSKHAQLIVNSVYRTGERGCLYKYLNPHLLALATIEIEHEILHIYLLDTISGKVILHTYHDGCQYESCVGSISLFIYENKFLYCFYNSLTLLTEVVVNDLWLTDPNSLPAKERSAAEGYLPIHNPLDIAAKHKSSKRNSAAAGDKSGRGGSVHLRNSSNTNVFSSLKNMNNFSPFITSQSYNFPFVIESFLDISRSKYAVSHKWILIQLKSGAIFKLDANFVNSRRPLSNELTLANKMEGLMNYRKFLPFQALWVLSQEYSLKNTIGALKSAETPIESTSLIFGYGIDLFFRRITPSKNFDTIPEDFDFGILFVILGGVVAAIFVARKYAQNRKLKAEWK